MNDTHKRILLVEDDATLRRLLIAYLEDQGHRVVGTDETQQAMDHLAGDPFDLVVTDGALKSSCGEEFAAQVGIRYPGIPILLVTGSIKNVNRALFAGVLRKPFLRTDFQELVRDTLEGAASQKEKAA